MLPTKRSHGDSKGKKSLSSKIAIAIFGFLFGCIVSTTIILNYFTIANSPSSYSNTGKIDGNDVLAALPNPPEKRRAEEDEHNSASINWNIGKEAAVSSSSLTSSSSTNPLNGVRILIAIASFDFSQIPHLEEVLDAYQDLCVTGASKVDVVIHSTVAYPVTLIDLLNSRLLPGCQDIFSITIVLKPSQLRLHLVDCHRELFYRKIDDYDLFIYTEDDARVTPRTVGAYLAETKKVQEIVGIERSSDFNVGIVRYEYNFPSNVLMDDKTRHATQNVTRVYWEHGFYPVWDKAVDYAPAPELKDSYLQMHNKHQGLFLATSFLLKAWKVRKGCNFDVASNRPGMKNNPSQPSEGTQRVWMSSSMLMGKRHCNVQQVIPISSFGTLTVLHLPNKNYRRVGKYHNRTFSDGTEVFDFGTVSSNLLTAMRLHIEIRNVTKQIPSTPYVGIRMVDEVGHKRRDRSAVLERRLGEYQAYVDRGGILSEEDMQKTNLVDES